MGLFSFLKFLKPDKTKSIKFDPNEYVPAFWEDGYCQIEIVPFENKAFIQKQAGQIDELATKSRTDYGFSATFERGSMPFKTVSKEIRVDYLEKTLTDFQFQKARHIRYDKSEILDCESGATKAFGFSNFTIFFDTEGEFVKNIWMHIGLIVSSPQFDLIQAALYALGEECELILIDWNSLELFDLADKKQIQKYLMGYWK
ncbi:hypothetical protein [Terrimonas pollutisoli]|uniref:hypothetical protein n=1 Tax=Terrimonas pollutisoli TaxID=3034147 RepID=UPI0023ED55E4|nr:hypothetical protein [Terrimonas sp. H1YJ31]